MSKFLKEDPKENKLNPFDLTDPRNRKHSETIEKQPEENIQQTPKTDTHNQTFGEVKVDLIDNDPVTEKRVKMQQEDMSEINQLKDSLIETKGYLDPSKHSIVNIDAPVKIKKERKKSSAGIVIVVIILLAIAACVYFFIIKGDKKAYIECNNSQETASYKLTYNIINGNLDSIDYKVEYDIPKVKASTGRDESYFKDRKTVFENQLPNECKDVCTFTVLYEENKLIGYTKHYTIEGYIKDNNISEDILKLQGQEQIEEFKKISEDNKYQCKNR